MRLCEAVSAYRASSGRRGDVGATAMAGSFRVDAQESDRDFIERAGSYFAMILLDELEDARHVSSHDDHRLALGRYGQFNPFASVERLLDSDNPSRTLRDEIRRAEDEAAGRGPIARVVLEARSQLELRFGALERFEQFDTRLSVAAGGRSFQLDLGELVRATEDADRSVVARGVGRLLGALPGLSEPDQLRFEDVAERLLPRLVGERDAVGDFGGLFSVPVAGRLHAATVLRYPGRARFVRASEVQGWGIASEEVLERAVANLAKRSEEARFYAIGAAGSAEHCVMARSGDGLDSARLLLPGLHDVLCDELGTPFIAGVPHRDMLLAAPCERAQALMARVSEQAAQTRAAISSELYTVSASGELSVFEP
ncbi:MAG: hypothetical protein OEZ06_26640 [Myxococcales bacterium]|nr:hypothetical protein [Myxococcales bacterium]